MVGVPLSRSLSCFVPLLVLTVTTSHTSPQYRKAILIVHPDRVQNDESATPQMKYTADIVFATLNEKYKEFEEAEM